MQRTGAFHRERGSLPEDPQVEHLLTEVASTVRFLEDMYFSDFSSGEIGDGAWWAAMDALADRLEDLERMRAKIRNPAAALPRVMWAWRRRRFFDDMWHDTFPTPGVG